MPPFRKQPGPRWRERLWLFFLVNYAALLALCSGFLSAEGFREPTSGAYLLAVTLTYPALYLLPALVVSLALTFLVPRLPRVSDWRAAGLLVSAPAVVLFGLVLVGVYADQRMHEIYGFHFNGFVWNLLTTPGGFASMGGGAESERAAVALVIAVWAVEALLWVLLSRLQPGGRRSSGSRALGTRRAVVAFWAGVVLLSVGERVAYGAAGALDYNPVLQWTDTFPLYQTTSMKSLARRLGVEVTRAEAMSVGLDHTRLAYPRRPIQIMGGAARPNIVVLCAESLRADMLTPEIMPATWAFAERATRFTHHLSGGNGTRMGVFGLFYGLPGNYWFKFLDLNRGPVLLRTLADAGYQIEAFTSDKFSYPEFDQTVFVEVPKASLHDGLTDPPKSSWVRDREGVTQLLELLDRRDRDRPFFAYFFFESPHARYEFPPETVIREPYLAELNYVTTDLEKNMPLIFNRYVNSVHHLDTQLARVFDYLEQSGLLANTIVIVTGDHGEEFMEKGRWGHGSAFTEEQIRVPLVLFVPDRTPQVVDRMTSHLDVPATLLALVGAANPASDYSLGQDLLDADARSYALVSDWSKVVYVDAEGKVTFPMKVAGFFQQSVTDRMDVPVSDANAFLRDRMPAFREILGDLGRFTRDARSSGEAPPAAPSSDGAAGRTPAS
jgi:hypothetical protein